MKNSFPAYFNFDPPQGYGSPHLYENYAFSAPVNFKKAAAADTVSNSSGAFKIFDKFGDMYVSEFSKAYEKEGAPGLITFDVSLKDEEALRERTLFSSLMVPENKIGSDLFDELYAIPDGEGAIVAYVGVKSLSEPVEYYDFHSLKPDYFNNLDDYKKSFDRVAVTVRSIGDVGLETEEILNGIK